MRTALTVLAVLIGMVLGSAVGALGVLPLIKLIMTCFPKWQPFGTGDPLPGAVLVLVKGGVVGLLAGGVCGWLMARRLNSRRPGPPGTPQS